VVDPSTMTVADCGNSSGSGSVPPGTANSQAKEFCSSAIHPLIVVVASKMNLVMR
jgi:hypothetical protein